MLIYMHAFRVGPFDTPHARGTSSHGHERGTILIKRLQCSNCVYVHTFPFSSPFVPRPMGGRYSWFAYSMASMHFTRNLSCTRRILLANRSYKLIRNQQVSPSMTGENRFIPASTCSKLLNSGALCKKKYADWEYHNREDLNELDYCLAQNPLSWSLADHHNGLPRWRITA